MFYALVVSMIVRAFCFCMLLGSAAAAAQETQGCNLSAAPEVPVIKNLAYDQARTALLAAGWVPGHGTQYSELAGNQVVFHDRGYTELRSCSLEQGEPCKFEFAGKGKTILKVTTHGEENAILETRAEVSEVELACAP